MSNESKKQQAKGWSQWIGEKGSARRLQLFEFTNATGKSTIYASHPTTSLPCGTRTRSLRHGDRDAAVRWAEEVIASGVELDAISIPKPEKKEVAKTADTKPKGKRAPKRKGNAKASTKKARK